MVSVMADAAIYEISMSYLELMLGRVTHRCNCRCLDVVLRTLSCKGFRERDETHLRGTVVGLPEVP